MILDLGGPPQILERHAMIRKVSLVLVGALMGATAMSVIYAASATAEAAGASFKPYTRSDIKEPTWEELEAVAASLS